MHIGLAKLIAFGPEIIVVFCDFHAPMLHKRSYRVPGEKLLRFSGDARWSSSGLRVSPRLGRLLVHRN